MSSRAHVSRSRARSAWTSRASRAPTRRDSSPFKCGPMPAPASRECRPTYASCWTRRADADSPWTQEPGAAGLREGELNADIRPKGGFEMTKMYLFAGAIVAVSMGMPATPAMAQAKKPNIVIIWGDDIGQSNVSAYSRGVMGYQTPNIDRIAREGMMFTDYLRRAELHRRPGVVPDRPVRPAHRPDQGRPAGRHGGTAEGRPDDRRALEGPGLCHRAVRQEPPGRPQRIPADGARLRRVLRQPLSPERRGRAGAARLPEGPRVPRQVRPARRAGLQGLGHGRPDGRPALRQGRQAGLQGHRSADQEADGDRSTTTSPPAPWTSSSGRTRPASRPSSG